MNITVVVARSNEWLKQARIETCENVPRTVEMEVPVSELSPTARASLLESNGGAYPQRLQSIKYNSDYTFGYSANSGSQDIVVDAISPTMEQVSQAVDAAIKIIADKRTAYLVKKQADEEAAKAKKQADEDLARKKKEAKELLQTEMKQFENTIASLTSDRDLLAKLIINIDENVLAKATDENSLDKDDIERAVPRKIGRVFDRG